MGPRLRDAAVAHGAGVPGGQEVVVLKFGSSVLAAPDGFRTAAQEVADEVGRGHRVVAVVSAPAGVTDALLRAASAISDAPPAAQLGHLLGTGESVSVALLGIALSALGLDVHLLSPAALGLRTVGPTLDADPVDLDAERLRASLGSRPVVVAPGFVGIGPDGEASLLGRGGSDLTALFLAHRLGARECRLLKDVDGLYPRDPRTAPEARPYERADWARVLEVGGELVQEKAVRFARAAGLGFRIAAPRGRGTWVGVSSLARCNRECDL
jgi:homoserine dehydrogenase